MKKEFQAIMEELYTIDPSLQAYESELIPILERMMRSRPHAVPDAAFVEHLRHILRERTTGNTTLSWWHSFAEYLHSAHSLRFTLTGALVGVIVAAPLTYSLVQSGALPFTQKTQDSSNNVFSYSVINKGSNAFNSLVNGEEIVSEKEAQTSPSLAMDDARRTRPQSGGGGPSAMMGMQPITTFPADTTQYRLEFTGTLPPLSETVPVFKRLAPTSATSFSSLLGTWNTTSIDLSSFSKANVDMLTFYEPHPYGYMGTLSFRDGSFSLTQQYDQWPHPEQSCTDEQCFARYRIQKNEIPTDEALFAIADSFIRERQIDIAHYGTPIIDHSWQNVLAASVDQAMISLPDTMRVIYPLIVEGKPVYDEAGMPMGISIGIHVREKRVSEVWGIANQTYEQSSYPGVTDEARIRAYLKSFFPPAPEQADRTQETIVPITLGTPTVSLVRMYTYSTQKSQELLVSALVFPVIDAPSDAGLYSNVFVVPLAEELFEQRTIDQPVIAR